MTSSEFVADVVNNDKNDSSSSSPTTMTDVRLDFTSDRFDAAFALAHREHVQLPMRVKPFDFLDRCRYLLPPDDPLHIVPPRRSAERASGTQHESMPPPPPLDPPPPQDTSNRLSVSNTLHDMMSPLIHGRFALLTELRNQRASATVTMRNSDASNLTRLYIGTLELFDRRGNVVLVDAREEPGNRPVPHVLLCGAHILSVTRTAS
jgi:small nuclear ribonucleoprotein (snRNP)-like protein